METILHFDKLFYHFSHSGKEESIETEVRKERRKIEDCER